MCAKLLNFSWFIRNRTDKYSKIMNCILFLHPVFWLFCAGLFLGAVAATLSVRPDRCKDPAKFRGQRPTKIYLALSGAIVCLSVALFVSSPDGLPPGFFLALLTGVLLCGFGLRFKKNAGIPLLIISIAACVFAARAFSGWKSAGKTVSVAKVLVLSLEEDAAVLSFTPEEGRETIIRASLQPGNGPSVKITLLRIPAVYLIFGAIPLYRIPAPASSGQDQTGPLPASSGWEKILFNFPGVRAETIETPLPPLSLFASYEILFKPRGRSLLVSGGP
ncbi:MAG: hypothetical protein LBK13_06965 [Spirochaetales bacterium]|nr:hypothetical protein [Spirochaetales bacterium]